MAAPFKIGEGYVEITSRVDKDQIAKDAQRAGDDAGESFGDKFDKAAQRETSKTGDKVGKTVGDGTTRESKKAGKQSGDTWAQEFEKALTGPRKKKKKGDGPKHNDDGPGFLSGFAKTLRKGLSAVFSPSTTMMFAKGIGGVLMSPPVLATIVAGAASLGTLIVSGLASTILVGLPVALAGGMLYLGVYMLRVNKQVRAAGKKMNKNLQDAFQTGLVHLIKPLLEAIKILDKMITLMRPTISAMFEALAPALVPLAEGLSGFLLNLRPGLLALTRLGTDGLINLAEWLPKFGTTLSNWFLTIQKNWPAIKKAFGEFFADFGKVVGFIANALIWLAVNYSAIKDVLGKVMSAANPVIAVAKAIWAIFKWLYDVLVGHSIIPDLVNGIISWFTKLPGKLIGLIGSMINKLVGLFISLATRAASAAGNLVSRVVSWLSGLPGKAARAVSRLWGAMAGAFSSAVSSARSRIGQLVNGAISVLSQLPGKARAQANRVKGAITGAFGNAGGWLRSAGSRIIGGLISGVQSQIGRLQGIFNSVTSRIPDWKGPADKDAVLLKPAGQLVIDGFMAGIASRIGGLRSQLEGLTTGMPAMAGAGAPAGAGASGLGTTITIGQLTIEVKGYLDPKDPMAARSVALKIRDAIQNIDRERGR